MSKGGAGKVYFVLYLAVILELLIIIVERDEAEEHLMQKQKESMKIVQSILAQLQSGSGATGVNTRRSDEITLKGGQSGEGYDLIKEERRYFVDVGVTDVSAEIAKVQNDTRLNAEDKAKRFAELVDLSNARELEYQIFYSSAKTDVIPEFPTEAEIKEYEKTSPLRSAGMRPSSDPKYSGWQLVALRKLKLDGEATKAQEPKQEAYKNPIYGNYDQSAIVGNIREYAPTQYEKMQIGEQQIFSYDKEQTDVAARGLNGQYKKRTFVAYFKPKQDGWYKVRFASKTNNILGVRGTSQGGATVSDEDEVNVGTVKLKVKELRAVRKEISRDLEGSAIVAAANDLEKNPTPENLDKFKNIVEQEAAQAATSPNEADRERVGKMRVYSYIVQLLTPQASESFTQNQGATEFDVRVVSAPKRQTGDPFVALSVEKLRVFDQADQVRIPFSAGPIINGKTPTIAPVPGLEFGPPRQVSNIAANQAEPGRSAAQTGSYELVITKMTPRSEPYEILVSMPHPSTGAAAVQKLNLWVYPSTAEIEAASAPAGGQLYVQMTPSSGNEIPPSQFTITGDIGGQKVDTTGFVLSGGNIPMNLASASYSVSWVAPPFVTTPVYLKRDENVEVRIAGPIVNVSQISIDNSKYKSTGTIVVSGIQILNKADFTIQKPEAKGFGATASAIQSIDLAESGASYKLTLKINKNAKAKTVQVRVSATQRHNQTGKVSSPGSKPLSIPIPQ